MANNRVNLEAWIHALRRSQVKLIVFWGEKVFNELLKEINQEEIGTNIRGPEEHIIILKFTLEKLYELWIRWANSQFNKYETVTAEEVHEYLTQYLKYRVPAYYINKCTSTDYYLMYKDQSFTASEI